jgi:hypothetical protein
MFLDRAINYPHYSYFYGAKAFDLLELESRNSAKQAIMARNKSSRSAQGDKSACLDSIRN